MTDLINPSGTVTPEQEEELRAYGRAMGAIDLGQTRDMMAAGSPWRILLGALRGVQSRSAIDAAESSRAGRRTRRSTFLPGVVSMDPGTDAPTTGVPMGSPLGLPPSSSPGAPGTPGMETPQDIPWGSPRAPRSIRTRNPGAIEYGPFARQMGATGSDGRFAIFPDPETGWRAMERLLTNYIGRGLSTLPQIIGTWAPAPENDVGAYVARVARSLGIRPDVRLTAADVPRLARAMATVESGIHMGGPPQQQIASVTASVPQATAGGGQLFTHTFAPGAPGSEVSPSPVAPPTATPPTATLGTPQAPQTPGTPGTPGTPQAPSAPTAASTSSPVDTGAVGGGGVPIRRVPTIPIGPEAGLSTDVAQESPVGSPEYWAQVSRNVPQRVAIDPSLTALKQRLRDPTSMSEQDYNKAIEDYQRLTQPRQVQTTYGTAIYNPHTGELQDFIPGPILRRPVSGGGVQTEQFLAPRADTSAGGFTIAPVAPTPGVDSPAPSTGTRTSVSSSMPPSLTPELPPFPESGSPDQIAAWGMQAGAIRGMIDKMAETHAGAISTAQKAAERAESRLQQLNTIATLTDTSRGFRLTGDRLADFQTRVAQFLVNFDPRSRSERPEVLRNLGERELLNKLNAFLASEATQDISARGTNFEFDTLLRNNPNLASSYEGTQMLLSYMRQEQQHILNLARMSRRLSPSQYGNWGAIVEHYYQQNPNIIEVPPTTNTNTGRTEPGRRISTARIPLPGEVKPDGQGTWTNEEIREHILRTVPPGTYFINPRTRNLSLVPLTASTSASAPR